MIEFVFSKVVDCQYCNFSRTGSLCTVNSTTGAFLESFRNVQNSNLVVGRFLTVL